MTKNRSKLGRQNSSEIPTQVVTEKIEDETGMVIIIRKPSLRPYYEEIKKRKPTKKFSVVIQPEFYDMIPEPKTVFIREAIIEKLQQLEKR